MLQAMTKQTQDCEAVQHCSTYPRRKASLPECLLLPTHSWKSRQAGKRSNSKILKPGVSRSCSTKVRAPRLESEFEESLQKTRQVSRSEEHTSELQSRFDLVCRLLLEKK